RPGLRTSAGAVASSGSTEPGTSGLGGFSAAGPGQVGSTTVCPGHRAGPCRGVPGGDFRTFGAPNWAAADGVSVSGVGQFGSGTCPTADQGACRFFGTSAAAPSAAGVAALVLQANGGKVAPRQLNALMATLAVARAGDGV